MKTFFILIGIFAIIYWLVAFIINKVNKSQVKRREEYISKNGTSGYFSSDDLLVIWDDTKVLMPDRNSANLVDLGEFGKSLML